MLMKAVLLLACLTLHTASSAKILGLFPYKGASHFYVFQSLLEELALRGHSVDVVSFLPRKEPLANYTDISVKQDTDESLGFFSFTDFDDAAPLFLGNLLGLRFLTSTYEKTHSLPHVIALANSSYDLVITEMFNSDLFFGLVYKIGAPVIGFSSSQILPWTVDTMGMPNDIPYPNVVSGIRPNMNFIDRLYNEVELWLARLFYHFVIAPDAQAIAEKYLGPLPPLGEIAANTSLLFVNTHFTLFGLRPFPPSIIEVGGINIREPKPLPKDLKKIYDNAESVIYFSMGSVLKASTLPPERKSLFVRTLKATGKTVLWKLETNLNPPEPNIHTRPWIPQRDVLAQPKTEVFISHCGLLGVNEAVISGVPIICIPIYGDQHNNAQFIEESGVGLQLDYNTLTESDISSALKELLNNKKYKQRAKELAASYKDRPLSALDTGVYWVEYLLRHGPKPFGSPFKKFPLWKRLGLDIALTIIGIFVLISYILVYVFKKLFLKKGKDRKEKQS